MIDNKKLIENFKSKNYTYCIDILQQEIKQKLVERVKLFKPDYKYTNLSDLKLNCYKYLNDKEKLYITFLCKYSEEEYPVVHELNTLLDIYSSYEL